MKSKKISYITALVIAAGSIPFLAGAHEAYVMEREAFWSGMKNIFSLRAFDALNDPANIRISFQIIIGVMIALFANFIFRLTKIGDKISHLPEKISYLGPFFVRFTIAGALFASAYSMSFLGPELPMSELPMAKLMQVLLYSISIMIGIGFLTEIAAFLGLIIFSIGFFTYGSYLFTYLNYVGELIVLLLFGMRRWSIDAALFKNMFHRLHKYEKYETTIVRVLYGLGLIYAGVTVKLLHPDLSLKVVNDWNLTQFHWLFPSDPLLVVLGAGLTEIAIGLLIIAGFELRFTVLITLFYITLSLFYFRELVWPHLLLYGISLNLLVQPEILTLDHFFFEKHRKIKSWWKRPLSAHHQHGKSSEHWNKETRFNKENG